jgi:hypothetical protein
MKSLFALGILVSLSAQAQVRTQEYEDRVFYIPRYVEMESHQDYINRWDAKRAPYPPIQVMRVPKPVNLPSTNQTGPLPGQTEEQRRRMESMSR